MLRAAQPLRNMGVWRVVDRSRHSKIFIEFILESFSLNLTNGPRASHCARYYGLCRGYRCVCSEEQESGSSCRPQLPCGDPSNLPVLGEKGSWGGPRAVWCVWLAGERCWKQEAVLGSSAGLHAWLPAAPGF